MGLIRYRYNISLAASMIAGGIPNEECAEKEINFLLGVLPKGTKHVETVPLAIAGLHIPYDIFFEHPVFEEGSSFDCEYVRAAWIENEKLEQGSMFLGIRYYKPDGTLRWPIPDNSAPKMEIMKDVDNTDLQACMNRIADILTAPLSSFSDFSPKLGLPVGLKCECGKENHGFAKHADWCDIKD